LDEKANIQYNTIYTVNQLISTNVE
jgi:hypothetical protein